MSRPDGDGEYRACAGCDSPCGCPLTRPAAPAAEGRREARFPVGPLSPDPDELRATPAAEAGSNEVAIEDVREILAALGIGTHARPYSAHDVVQREVLPALQRLVEQAAEAAQLRKTLARARSMRKVATAGTVTTAALDWALDGTDG